VDYPLNTDDGFLHYFSFSPLLLNLRKAIDIVLRACRAAFVDPCEYPIVGWINYLLMANFVHGIMDGASTDSYVQTKLFEFCSFISMTNHSMQIFLLHASSHSCYAYASIYFGLSDYLCGNICPGGICFLNTNDLLVMHHNLC
jgi:hypothetical protein